MIRQRIIAAAIAATASATILAPVSVAAPREWDLGSYDSCVSKADNAYLSGSINSETYGKKMKQCCDSSGGVWKPGPGGGDCVAPGKEENVAGSVPIGPHIPSKVLPPGVIQKLEPAP
jgi:hypothetical protein